MWCQLRRQDYISFQLHFSVKLHSKTALPSGAYLDVQRKEWKFKKKFKFCQSPWPLPFMGRTVSRSPAGGPSPWHLSSSNLSQGHDKLCRLHMVFRAKSWYPAKKKTCKRRFPYLAIALLLAYMGYCRAGHQFPSSVLSWFYSAMNSQKN